ncbi:bifunctional hydroxymethylpyrimidine kinase/phosphomethylpyrimidine kinase [uncultured Bacteroides sp.]|uniref:bifunctional hydroxymethylpyrimidine kinase/phosphomethylpyrimidine kinase n=1 Tax=uncultured Bacteroides sp. TaxID=162156 RepID=UPI0025FC7FD5|nr:bifunctional hydroxymethylpyrimidine kinase/phosphomethylpyrimidine kinase [uncultured Bacteroides sp.]
MKKYHSVLTIAGSDCSGGAGIQADIKAISALGGYAASAITAITVQNTCGVTGIHPVPASYVKAQIEAVMTDIKPSAVKIGMINDVEIVKAIAESIKEYKPKFIVFDPVMVSTSGCKLIEDKAIEAIKKELIPLSTIITPNLSEAMVLTGDSIDDAASMTAAGNKILESGCGAVLIKGGHLEGNDMCDVLCIKGENTPYIYTASKISSKNTHGTGCTLSSSIATYLALGETLREAVRKAKDYVHKGILNGKDVCIGSGHGPLNHFYSPVPMHIFNENE